jgi:hypothetical protein
MNCVTTKVLFFLFLVLLFPCIASAAIKVDGHLDEPEWAGAQSYRDFAVIEPMTLGTPPYTTEARVLATREGLAVAFICEQPSGVKRTRTVTSRDAQDFDSDSVTLLVDFDGTGKIAYELSVSISGSYRDGMNQNTSPFPNSDWDAVWEHAVYEEPERWTVEMLLPWSIAAMRDGVGKTRQIGMFFKRNINETKQTFGFPGISEMQANFMTKFTKVEVPSYTSQQLDIVPYVTVLSDLVKNEVTGKAGLDVSWKPNNKFQLAATVNPDFGQVESDELVINFSTIETRFSDKRPFFTENQGIFNISMPGSGGGGGPGGGGNQVIYTRRIGGPSDNMGEVSTIDGALKIIGSEGVFNYGVLAAKEDHEAGRTSFAGRMVIPGNNWSMGGVSTYVERPFLNRTGMVNAVDYDFQFGGSWRWNGQVLGSRIKKDDNPTSGTAVWSSLEYSANKDQHYMVSVSRYDYKFDMSDMGYLMRNNLEALNLSANWQMNNFTDQSVISSLIFNLNGTLSRNTYGNNFPATINCFANVNIPDGSNIMFGANFNSPGFDDTISRDNDKRLVRLNQRLGGNVSYSTQRQGAWKESIGFRVSQEGVNGWGGGIDADATWYPTNNFNLDLRVSPNWCADWLLWVRDSQMGPQMGSFSRNQVTGELSANWFPAVGHEFRLKAQWATVNAEAEQSYYIGNGGRLIKDNEPMEDFAMVNFGLQFRYRYEIGPLSDLYVVYSRGGFDPNANPDQSTLNLLNASTELSDSDQILIKFRYGF